MKRPSDCKIQRKVSIILSQMIAPAVDAIHETGSRIVNAARGPCAGPGFVVGDRLRGVSLHAYVARETSRQVRIGIEVESVSLVTVRRRIFRCQIVEIGVAETEWI